MRRLLVHVEGYTEEAFVKVILRPHLLGRNFAAVSARLLGNARQRSHRGGIRAWPAVRGEIERHLKEDPGCYATTMVDFYRMPATGPNAWPGREDARTSAMAERATVVEAAMREDLEKSLGPSFERARFIPFVMLHEFEALLFSDTAWAMDLPEATDLARSLRAIRDGYASPEDINDDELTAPSKRILGLYPRYDKVLHGVNAANCIGLRTLRDECRHFDEWIAQLEN